MNRATWLRDVEDALEEQGFRCERVSDGHAVKIFPKVASLGQVVVRWPGSDRHAIQNCLSAMRRIGVNLTGIDGRPQRPKEHDVEHANSKPVLVHAATALPPALVSDFQLVREKIDLAVGNLGEAIEVLNRIEADGAKLTQLRALLREAL